MIGFDDDGLFGESDGDGDGEERDRGGEEKMNQLSKQKQKFPTVAITLKHFPVQTVKKESPPEQCRRSNHQSSCSTFDVSVVTNLFNLSPPLNFCLHFSASISR